MVPNIDFNIYSDNALPPNKRLPKWMLWMRSLIYMWQLRWAIFYRYMNGSIDATVWDNTTSFDAGDLCRDLNGVYESLTDSNVGNATTDETYWFKVLDFFVGASERAKHNSQKLSYERQLNELFDTTFREPTSIDPGVGYLPLSDIYITTDPPVYTTFAMATTWYMSDDMGATESSPFYMDTTPVYSTSTTYLFTVHIPVTVYTALGSSAEIRESIASEIISRYKLIGTSFQIVTY